MATRFIRIRDRPSQISLSEAVRARLSVMCYGYPGFRTDIRDLNGYPGFSTGIRHFERISVFRIKTTPDRYGHGYPGFPDIRQLMNTILGQMIIFRLFYTAPVTDKER